MGDYEEGEIEDEVEKSFVDEFREEEQQHQPQHREEKEEEEVEEEEEEEEEAEQETVAIVTKRAIPVLVDTERSHSVMGEVVKIEERDLRELLSKSKEDKRWGLCVCYYNAPLTLSLVSLHVSVSNVHVWYCMYSTCTSRKSLNKRLVQKQKSICVQTCPDV